MKMYYKSNINDFDGGLSKISKIKLQKWFTKNPVILDIEYLTSATTNRNNKQYTWCIYCNNGNGAWGYNWVVFHK